MARTPTTQVNTTFAQTSNITQETNSILFISSRGTVRGSDQLGLLKDVDLYTPYRISGQYTTNAAQLLTFFKNDQGAVVNIGIEDTINLVPPNSATVSTINAQLFTTLTWTTEPAGWDDIVGVTIVGTASQGAASGTIEKVSTSEYAITLSNVTSAFTTTTPIVLNYVNTSVQLPDGKATEKFVLDSYYIASVLQNLESTVNVSVTTPTVDILIVSDRDSLFNANPTETDLGDVDEVIDNLDGTLTLVWDTQPTNWLYVPPNGLGNSSIEGATPADIATIEKELGPQYTPGGDGYALLVTPAGGASFVATDTISMTLDDSISMFEQIKGLNYKFIGVNYELEDTDEITTAAGVLYPFTTYLASRNLPEAVDSQSFIATGVVGSSKIFPDDLLTLGNIDNGQYIVPAYPYKQTFNDPYIQGGQVAAAQIALNASNLVPYSNMDDFVLSGLPVSSDAHSYISVGSNEESEDYYTKGLSPIGVNQQSQAYNIRTVTAQLTIPGTGLPDNEFYDLHVRQVLGELKERTWAVSKQPSFQNTEIKASLLKTMENGVFGMLQQAENEDMIKNTALLKSTIVVLQDLANPNRVNISYDSQPTFTLEEQVYTNNIITSLTTPTTAT